MTAPAVSDAAARGRISSHTDETMFVDAGAGSGKTAALVNRVRTLVLRDGVPLARIAAVTFTEKAGAELRDRLREKFEAAQADHDTKQIADTALDDLDGAAIGTLHSFAQRVLGEHPIEAGLPPLIDVLDEVGSSVAFDERWAGLQTELLDDESVAEPLLLALAAGVKLDHLRILTQLLTNDWDLIADRVLDTPEPRVDVSAIGEYGTRFHDYLQSTYAYCADAGDSLRAKLDRVLDDVERLLAAPDAESQLPVLTALADTKYGNVGTAARWNGQKPAVVERCRELSQEAARVHTAVADGCLRVLTRWIAHRVLDQAEVRRGKGRLEFHDLLVLARDLLRTDAGVREAVHHDYERVLLDEFQDTDPLQIDIAARICGGRDASGPRWEDTVIPPGRLFVVGDAKQSIYRFRRASIRTYLEARAALGGTTELTTNFRTVPDILDWVNGVFGELITPVPDAQPGYEPLRHHRLAGGIGAPVTVLGADAHPDTPNAATLREREAADVAGIARRIVADGWTVWDERRSRWRTARYEDVVVLVPARTSLPFLTEALDAAGIPFRAEASSLVYQAAEIRALLACVRAIADSTDALSLVTALRSPLFGCGDDDLWTWKRDGGRFSIYADASERAGHPVARALRYLRQLSFDARWLTPSEVLGRLVADRRMFETAAGGPRARDEWRRLRFVVDQARAWSEAAHGGLRAYAAWAARQGLETTRVAEAVLPETDAASVRLLTIHAAKGLEFPIVIMSGMTSRPRTPGGPSLLWPSDGGYAVRARSGVQTDDFDTVQPIDEQMDVYERARLLYVAATRARDHLVVSLHRGSQGGTKTAAQRIAATATALVGVERFESSDDGQADPLPGPAVAPPPEHAGWLAGIVAAQQATQARSAQSASGLEGTEPDVVFDPAADTGWAKGQRDLDLPPWSKGRYGSAIGRAVHGVLQSVDLASGDGLDAAVAAQVVAEGVTGDTDLVLGLARSALRAEIVVRAAAREHWRETYVGTVHDDGVVHEGYVDLIFRDDDGSLAIVDYKTDAVPAAAIASRVEHYRPQLTEYRQTLSAATGASVTTTLLFLHPTAGATEVRTG